MTLSNKVRKYYKAEIVLEFIINKFNETIPFASNYYKAVGYGVMWGFMQVGIKLLYGSKFHGDDSIEIAIQYLDMLVATILFYWQFMFYKQAIIDIERKFWIMKQLSLIISPRSMQSKWTKFLPTICLLDPVSLRAWLNIRRIGLDYGRKYFYRHEVFLPVTLLLMSLNIIGCFAIFLLLKSDWTEIQISRMKQLLVSMMIDSILFFFSGFHFIFLAGALNDEFRIHIRTLDNNKLLFRDIMNLRGFYFKDQHVYSASSNQPESEILDGKPQSHLHNKLIVELLHIIPKHKHNSEKAIIEEL